MKHKKIIIGMLIMLSIMTNVSAWTHIPLFNGDIYGVKSITLVNNNPCIAYHYNLSDEFTISCYIDSGWVDYNTGYYNISEYAITEDNLNGFGVAFLNGSNTVYYDGITTEIIETSIYSTKKTAIDFDSDNHPHILTIDASHNTKEYYFNGDSWVCLSVSSSYAYIHDLDIKITPEGKKYMISFSQESAGLNNGYKYFAYANTEDGAWTSTNFNINFQGAFKKTEIYISSSGKIYYSIGDEAGNLHMSLYKSSNTNPIDITNFSKIWDKRELDNGGGIIENNLLYIDGGNLYISEYLEGSYTNSTLWTIDSNIADIVKTDTHIYISYVKNNIVYLGIRQPTYTLSGIVFDGYTLDPIITLPTISLNSGEYSDVCDIDGNYLIDEIPSGTYNYTYSAVNYIDETGVIVINENTNKDVALYSESHSNNLSNVILSFIDDLTNPITNITFKFEYIGDCSCLIGNEYYKTTDSNGKITTNFYKGNYELSKGKYTFRLPTNDFYSDTIDLSIYPVNYQKVIYVKKGNITHNIKITVLNNQIYTAINNTYVSLTSLENFYSGYTNENGELNLTVQNGNYEVILEHSNYIMDYSQLIYDFEFLTQSEWVFSITPKTSLYSSISGNIYDADTGSAVNATDIHLHTINRHDIIQNSNIYSFQNITNPIPSESLDISLFVEASGYMPYHWEYPDFPIGINLTHNIYLNNVSSCRIINATFTHSYDLPNVFIRLSSSDEYHWAYLNSSNSIELYNLSKNTIYNFYAWTGDEYNYLYRENYDIIQVNETNFSYIFTLEKRIPIAIFNGHVYTSNDFGISGVHMELISGNQKYTFTTNSDGYFSQAINADLEYTLNISKDGFIPNPLIVNNITVPLESDEGNIYHLYSEEELNIFYAHIKSNETLHIGGANVILTMQSNNEVFYFKSDDSGIAVCEIPEGIYSIRILKDGYKEYNEKDIIISNSQSKYFTIEKIPIGDFTFTEKDFFNLLFEFGWLILAIVIGLFVLALIIMLLREIRG